MWAERYGVSSCTDCKQELEKHCTSFYSQQENMTLSINYRSEKYWKILRTDYFSVDFKIYWTHTVTLIPAISTARYICPCRGLMNFKLLYLSVPDLTAHGRGTKAEVSLKVIWQNTAQVTITKYRIKVQKYTWQKADVRPPKNIKWSADTHWNQLALRHHTNNYTEESLYLICHFLNDPSHTAIIFVAEEIAKTYCCLFL